MTKAQTNPPLTPHPSFGNSSTTEKYDGAELKPFNARPGSQDSLLIPSLIGSKRVYRKDAK
jgi:hypothetical protein